MQVMIKPAVFAAGVPAHLTPQAARRASAGTGDGGLGQVRFGHHEGGMALLQWLLAAGGAGLLADMACRAVGRLRKSATSPSSQSETPAPGPPASAEAHTHGGRSEQPPTGR